ncbi:MAG TPA: alpha/beta hydrolase [Candidatus Nitrosotalea sp.]|nr:alpha/beta hydrolase [Candidatus Nitrosotalea sp.]
MFIGVLIMAAVIGSTARGDASGSSVSDAPRLDRTNLLLYHDQSGQVAPVRSISDWQKRRAEILHGFVAVAGTFPSHSGQVPLDIDVREEVDCGDYVRRLLTYTSEPGSRVPAYLLIPKSALGGGRKAVGILCLHQTHALGQKVVVGLGSSPNDEYGVELVRRGYVCLAPAYPLLADYHPDLKKSGYQSGTMKAIHDNIRGLDLLESLPFVKPKAFGAIGHSLGGHNAIFTAVFDDRLKAIAVSCGFDSFLDYMNGDIRGWTGERYMPRLLSYCNDLSGIPFDFHELIGALAPRAVFVSAPLGDTNFKWRSVDVITQAASQVYALYGVPGNLHVEHPDCVHLFPREMREAAYKMFDEQLK